MATLKEICRKTVEERLEAGKEVAKRYCLVQKLGEGGGGSVWLAEDKNDGNKVALKLLDLFKSKDEHSIEALKSEFSILKELDHPNIYKLYDFGIDDIFGVFFVSEFINGHDLFKATAGQTPKYCEDLFVQILRALVYLHSRNVIHFDIKPANILVVGFNAKLIDFGLATHKAHETAKGTFSYMPPEMLLEQGLDARADLYSLGVLFNYVLTRTNPFSSRNLEDAKEKHLKLNVAPPTQVDPSIPKYFDIIIPKMLQKNPAERYQSAQEVLRDIILLSPNKYDIESSETQRVYIPANGKIVGRENEQSVLQQYVNDLKNNQTPFIAGIVGEIGIGKTRLLKDIKYFAQLHECDAISVNENTDKAIEMIANKISDTEHRPVILFIDDLAETLSSNNNLSNILGVYIQSPNSGLIYTNSVPATVFGMHQNIVRLENFSAKEISEYLKVVANPPEKHLNNITSEFLNRTKGNPALVTGLCLKLAEHGFLAGQDGQWEGFLFDDITIDFSNVSVPQAMASSLLARLDKLPKDALDILNCLAIFGLGVAGFSLRQILKVKNERNFNATISNLIGQNLITTDHSTNTYRIIDEFTKTVVIEKISREETNKWQEKVADHLISLHNWSPDNFATHQNCQACAQIYAHLAYGTNTEISHQAVLRLTQYERRLGLVVRAKERLEEKIADEHDEIKRESLTVELGECYFQLRKFSEIEKLCKDSTSSDLKFLRCRSLIEQNKFNDAEKYLNEIKKIKTKNYLARIKMLQGKFDEAINFYKLVKDEASKLPESERSETLADNELGEALRLKGDLKPAIIQLKEELTYFEKAGLWHKAIIRYYSIAETCRVLSNLEEASRFFVLGINKSKELANSQYLGRLYNGYGGMLAGQNKFKEAISQFKDGLAHCYRIGDMTAAAIILLNIGRCYNGLKDEGSAKHNLLTALTFFEHDGSKPDWADNIRCQIYLELGDVLRQEKSNVQALEYLEKAEQLAMARDDLEIYKNDIQKIKKQIAF